VVAREALGSLVSRASVRKRIAKVALEQITRR
jgi:hypothetical protein